jgi:hypothetical protein
MQIKLLNNLISRPSLSNNLIQNIRALAVKSSPEQQISNEKNTPVKKTKPDRSSLNVESLITKKLEVFSPTASKLVQSMIKKATGKDKEEEDEEKGEKRKGPFKNYQETEERDKKQIMFYEEYFDKISKRKDRENFMASFFYL